MTEPRILVVEDDIDIADLLTLHLTSQGYAVDHLADGAQAQAALARTAYDLVVLDLGLPGASGFDVCRALRAQPRYTPVFMVSARGAEPERILGLNLGADDYLAKPFSVLELVARVNALFRRRAAMSRDVAARTGQYVLGPLNINAVARTLAVRGAAVKLTAREFDLLLLFAQHPECVFSRVELLERVWGLSYEGYEHTVNTHINRLRAKIEDDPAHPLVLQTVWGVGYKLVAPE